MIFYYLWLNFYFFNIYGIVINRNYNIIIFLYNYDYNIDYMRRNNFLLNNIEDVLKIN